jgi:hypothetical protein
MAHEAASLGLTCSLPDSKIFHILDHLDFVRLLKSMHALMVLAIL